MFFQQCADTYIHSVEPGKVCTLRIIKSALSDELFFTVSRHTLTVAEVDATYTKPFTATAIMAAPGQTTNVLTTANQIPDSAGMFVMAASSYRASVFPFDNSSTVGFLRYKNTSIEKIKPISLPTNLAIYNLPEMEDTDFATDFFRKPEA